MADNNDDWQEKLVSLRHEYAAALPGKVHLIEQAANCWYENLENKDLLQSLYLLVHSLAGSGATFGFHELGALASTTEHLIQKIPNFTKLEKHAASNEIRQLLLQIKAALPR